MRDAMTPKGGDAHGGLTLAVWTLLFSQALASIVSNIAAVAFSPLEAHMARAVRLVQKLVSESETEHTPQEDDTIVTNPTLLTRQAEYDSAVSLHAKFQVRVARAHHALAHGRCALCACSVRVVRMLCARRVQTRCVHDPKARCVLRVCSMRVAYVARMFGAHCALMFGAHCACSVRIAHMVGCTPARMLTSGSRAHMYRTCQRS